MLSFSNLTYKFDDLTTYSHTEIGAYESETRKTLDAKKAIALAYYYRSDQVAIEWLCQAKLYLKNQTLSQFIDLNDFFSHFKKISTLSIFSTHAEEIADAVAKCLSIKELCCCNTSSYNKKLTKKIGRLLTNTTSIEKVQLWSVRKLKEGDKLNSKTITPITQALLKNTSIKFIDLADSHIGDKGASKLFKAIEHNLQSGITELNLYNCSITDESAKKLIQLLYNKKQIEWINIRANPISEPFKQHIQTSFSKFDLENLSY